MLMVVGLRARRNGLATTAQQRLEQPFVEIIWIWKLGWVSLCVDKDVLKLEKVRLRGEAGILWFCVRRPVLAALGGDEAG